MAIDWEKKIIIDKKWVDRQLNYHFHDRDLKVAIRGYTPKVSGTSFSCDDLVSELGYMVTDYVISENRKKDMMKDLEANYGSELGKKYFEQNKFQTAQRFFGKKDPNTDGKYGELLLFAVVESILNSKMVAHKISNLTNPKDQVKGGDGIFLGDYKVDENNIVPAIFIGESKIKQGFSDSVKDALDSINRFHCSENKSEVNNMEFIVARDTLMVDEDYEEIYQRLSPGTIQYKAQVLVHPVLIMFNTAKIATLEIESLTAEDLETRLKLYMEETKGRFLSTVKEKIKEFPEVSKVFLDIFLFPFNDISKFRNAMYYNIHGISFKTEKDGK